MIAIVFRIVDGQESSGTAPALPSPGDLVLLGGLTYAVTAHEWRVGADGATLPVIVLVAL